MKHKLPHPIPYQGSKRNLAERIMRFANSPYETLYEPFAGSAAITVYAARHNLAKNFVIGDSFSELIELWRLMINNPEKVANEYANIWNGQKDGDFDYFLKKREEFNTTRDPVILLYLIARCVKNAVRFNKHGYFTQSADKRRKGTNPSKMQESIFGVSHLLRNKTEFHADDFSKCIQACTKKDLVYMDPPYQGTTYGRDKRYYHQLNKELLYAELGSLNKKGVHWILSYDGHTGDTVYGEELPSYLDAEKFLLNAGRSSQATLSGKDHITYESLYLSRNLHDLNVMKTKEKKDTEQQQTALFA